MRGYLYILLLPLLFACASQPRGVSEFSKSNGPTRSTAQKDMKVEVAVKVENSVEGGQAPEKLFNVAMLTQSVQCLFCHVRIEGDVGGIHFPEDKVMHERSGEGLRILGQLFATNDVPSIFSSGKVSKGVISNYKNTGLKIFPTQRSTGGEITFPEVTKELISGKTKGTLKADASIFVTDRYSGTLVAMGIQAPLEVNGEIHIDGDLIIGGRYRGVGTIYARNIFIVRDLKGEDVPYPFSLDAKEALAQGKTAVSNKKDALYLLALGQITVGYPDPEFIRRKDEWRKVIPKSAELTTFDPPMSLDAYSRFAEVKNCAVSTGGFSSEYRKILVNRVDSFLYANDTILWRTCNGYELNGGFIAPNVAIVNAGDANEVKDAEPTNVVRYDYRLRAGIKAYSILKAFFEAE